MTYTCEAILKAAELAEIPTVTAKYMATLLDEAEYLIKRQKPEYIAPDVEHLFKDVCRVSGFTATQLRIRSRKREISYTRHAFAALACELFPGKNLDTIGSYMCQKHDTVIYYRDQVEKVREKHNFYLDIKKKIGIV